MIYIEDIDDYIQMMVYIEDRDDYIQMNEPADYYKDEYGICPYCKHKLSEEEMERKRCSKCLQKLSGKTIDFTRKGLIKRVLVVRTIIAIAILIMIPFVLDDPIRFILGIAAIVLVILLVWGFIWGVSD